MAARISKVERGVLRLPNLDSTIPVDSADWYAWLADGNNSSFSFAGQRGRFTARREERQRGGTYWIAYRRLGGILYKAYLGKAKDLTLERLSTVAAELDLRIAESQGTTTERAASTGGGTVDSADSYGLLTTKLYVPPVSAMTVSRPQLRARLEEARRGALTLISAPAGSGKTSLLSMVIRPRPEGERVAWVSLDEHDDDVARFWWSVLAALQRVEDPGFRRVGATMFALLRSPGLPPPEVLATTLLNDLVKLGNDVTLVLDDYHVIESQQIHAGLMYLVDHAPSHVHLVLAARVDPPLPLARWRVSGRLREFRGSDLRFTRDEIAAFLAQAMKAPLTDEQVAAVEQRTEGWAAGLHLLALLLRERTDISSLLAAFTGSHRFVLDYLVEEVLLRQPEPIRQFLLQTAILDRLCAALCTAVTGTTEAASVLATVERANLFLIPLDDDRHWYRYHHLFAEMLCARLDQEQPLLVVELHRRASEWFAGHNSADTAMRGEAIRHAVLAGDNARAVQLIGDVAHALWARGELTTLGTWLTSLPSAALHAYPRYTIMLAQVQLSNGSLAEVPPLLDVAAKVLEEMPRLAPDRSALRGGIAALRSHIERISGQLDAAIALAEEALVLLPEAEQIGRVFATLGLAMTHHEQGELQRADTVYRAAIALSVAMGDRHLEMTTRGFHGRLLQELGDLTGAEAALQQAMERSTDGAELLPIAGWALIGLGTVAYARNMLQEAEEHLVAGMELSRRGGIRDAMYLGSASLIRLRLAQGDIMGAARVVALFMEEVRAGQAVRVGRWAAAFQALVDLARGDMHAAEQWAQGYTPQADMLFFTDKEAFMVYIRVLLALGQTDVALLLIREHRAHAAPLGHVETQIEMYLLETVALVDRGAVDEARVALDAALALAAPSGFVRLFLDAAVPIARLLTQYPQGHPSNGFAEHLLTAFRQGQPRAGSSQVHGPMYRTGRRVLRTSGPPASPLIEPLTARELDVLRLMALGLSNQFIAERLIISVQTVKKHGSNIFGKLHASNRTEAVARARTLGLLP